MTTKPLTVGNAIDAASATLAEVGIENARREACLLVHHVTGISTAKIRGFPDLTLRNAAWRKIGILTGRRAQREPMAYLIKKREFWSLSFEVSKDTLIPRPDSETLIEAILYFIPNREAPLRILDLGTGSGCLLGALLEELKHASGLGIDVDEAASIIARRNMKRLGFAERAEIRTGDWGKGITESFDVIVCNPPYIPSGNIKNLENDVRQYEPRVALDGGEDGLEAYRIIASNIFRILDITGLAAFEVGLGQVQAVTQIFQVNGLEIKHSWRDLASRDRCLLATVRN